MIPSLRNIHIFIYLLTWINLNEYYNIIVIQLYYKKDFSQMLAIKRVSSPNNILGRLQIVDENNTY